MSKKQLGESTGYSYYGDEYDFEDGSDFCIGYCTGTGTNLGYGYGFGYGYDNSSGDGDSFRDGSGVGDIIGE